MRSGTKLRSFYVIENVLYLVWFACLHIYSSKDTNGLCLAALSLIALLHSDVVHTNKNIFHMLSMESL